MVVAFIFVAAFAAFLVSAVAGGGAGLVLVPLLRLILPIASIPAALSIGTAASSLSRIYLFRSAIRWDVVRRFVPTALPAAALGAWLLTLFEPVYVEFLLGCFLLLNLPALFRRDDGQAGQPMPLGRLPVLGAAAGLLSGFTGAVGVVFNRAYYRMGMTKAEIVATRATNEVLLHLLKIALYAGFGLLPRSALLAGAMVAVAALAASFASRWLLPLMRDALFRRIGLVAMIASGIAMFSLSGHQILTIHQAWVDHVAPGDEHELQLYWGGTRRFAIEREDEGNLVVERVIRMGQLPAAVRGRPSRDRAAPRDHDGRGGPWATDALLRNLLPPRRPRREGRADAGRHAAAQQLPLGSPEGATAAGRSAGRSRSSPRRA